LYAAGGREDGDAHGGRWDREGGWLHHVMPDAKLLGTAGEGHARRERDQVWKGEESMADANTRDSGTTGSGVGEKRVA